MIPQLIPSSWFKHRKATEFTLRTSKKKWICISCWNSLNSGTYYLRCGGGMRGGSRKYCCKCFLNNVDESIKTFKKDCGDYIKDIKKLKRKISGKRVMQKNIISQL
tara:strand:+ start:804 stop:1121 length:318 start_codon:yes stop_codon:yes gene_type:complete